MLEIRVWVFKIRLELVGNVFFQNVEAAQQRVLGSLTLVKWILICFRSFSMEQINDFLERQCLFMHYLAYRKCTFFLEFIET